MFFDASETAATNRSRTNQASGTSEKTNVTFLKVLSPPPVASSQRGIRQACAEASGKRNGTVKSFGGLHAYVERSLKTNARTTFRVKTEER